MSVLSTACGFNGEDAFKALFGFVILAIVSLALIGVALWAALKSSVVASVYVGILLGIIIQITIQPGIQLALIGGLLGISMDKLASKATANLPVTVIDRLALLVSRIADSIRDASTDAGNPTHIRSVRRGVWVAVLSIFTTLLIGKVANDIGLTGTVIYNHLF